MKRRRRLAFLVVATTTAVSLLAAAQPRRGAPRPAPAAAPAKRPPAKPGTTKPPAEDIDASAPMAGREEKTQAAPSLKDAGTGGVVEAKTIDGGAKVFRFGEVEVEGRLKSPQIVYFLRRVRAEFAAGDLGHRTFMRELSETRNEPAF